MKRILVSLLMMLAIGSTAALAADEPGISKQVKQNFEKEFPGARSVKWNNLGDYQVATFSFENNRVEAYFNTGTGQLEGAARYILFDQLPLPVKSVFNKNFDRTGFLSALEIANTEGICYVLTAETQNKKYHLKVRADGYVFRKIKLKQ